MITLLFYSLLILVCAWFSELAAKRNQKWLLWIPVILFAIVAGCRAPSVGTDTQRVMEGIIRGLQRAVFDHSKEYLYHFICKLSMRIWPKPSFALTVLALITNSAVLFRLWDFVGKMSMAAAVCLYGFFYFGASMNIVRQVMAVALVFYFSRYLFELKYLRFCVGAVIAASIHISACIAVAILAIFLIYFDSPGFRKIHFSRGVIVLCSLIGGLFLVAFLRERYADYLNFTSFRIGIMQPVAVAVFLAVYILTPLKMRRVAVWTNRKGTLNISFRFLFLLGFAGYIISFFEYVVPDLGRFNYYFKIFEVVFYGVALKQKYLDTGIRIVVMLALILLGLYSLYTYGGLVPYHFIWQG